MGPEGGHESGSGEPMRGNGRGNSPEAVDLDGISRYKLRIIRGSPSFVSLDSGDSTCNVHIFMAMNPRSGE